MAISVIDLVDDDDDSRVDFFLEIFPLRQSDIFYVGECECEHWCEHPKVLVRGPSVFA